MAVKREFTHAEFDSLSWHDNEIYAFEFRVGDPDEGDWTSDLVFDIDYIAEWVQDGPNVRFLVAPATLVFHGVTDLRFDIDSGTEGNQVALVLPSIAAIEREPIGDQKIYLDRPYYRWSIRLNGTPNGEIHFGAVGFTQTLRRDPVRCEQQRLPRSQRNSS